MSFITSYNFNKDQNTTFLSQILKIITTHKISPTPLNYAIFYEYFSGKNKNLITTVDSLIKEKKSIDNECAIKLYKKYICDFTFESFDKINQDIQSLINQTSETLIETTLKASTAEANFEERALSIASAESKTDIQLVITDIINETKDLANVSHLLKSELEAAHKEMEQLQLELTQVREDAAIDSLTGLLNRGTFDDTLNNLIVLSNNSTEACLIMLDLDHFKKINDNFGHVIGDKVLKFTANLLKKHAESHHHVARYGGEELAIIMPNTSLKKALNIAENIRTSLESSRLKKKNTADSIGKITVSIGISILKLNDTPEDVIMRADKALYKAKSTGRNKVVTESIT